MRAGAQHLFGSLTLLAEELPLYLFIFLVYLFPLSVQTPIKYACDVHVTWLLPQTEKPSP